MQRFLLSETRSRGLGIAATIGLFALSGCAKRGGDDIGTFITLPSANEANTIKVGMLHSLSGAASSSEVNAENGEMMAIVEINRNGGVLGKQVEPIIEDGASNDATFVEKSKKLLEQDKVAVVFGCGDSDSRKAVKPIFEKDKGLLFYPMACEGEESSPNIFYTGAEPSDQVVPAVEFLLKQGKKRFFLLGDDNDFSHTINKIVKAQLGAEGGTVVGEEYAPVMPKYANRKYSDAEIKALRAQYKIIQAKYGAMGAEIKNARPDAVVNTLGGYSNRYFLSQLKDTGLTADQTPILALNVAETAVNPGDKAGLAGDFCASNYFETTNTPENDKFVKEYKLDYGDDHVTDASLETGYLSVYLWKEMAEKAKSTAAPAVIKAADGITFDAPEGEVKVDGKSHYLWKIARVGKVRPDGLIDEVWSSGKAVEPDPYLKKIPWAKGLIQ